MKQVLRKGLREIVVERMPDTELAPHQVLIRPQRLRREGVFAPGAVERRWSAHPAGEADWSGCLWAVLMFQLWREASRGGAGCEFCN